MRARKVYDLLDVGITLARRSIAPVSVDLSWRLGNYTFDTRFVSYPTDAVVNGEFAAAMHKEGFDAEGYCLVLAGTIGLPFTGTYNVERVRRDNAFWSWNVWSHYYNW